MYKSEDSSISEGPPDLFPAIEPNRCGTLDVDRRHTIYWEETGNPKGIPVVFLHGGPGAGVTPNHRRFFDPDAYRILLFDQRGAGRSTPYAETVDNTTEHLISDMEALRVELGVGKWLVFGGSWGAMLAVSYASKYAGNCLGLILRGVFLGRDSELNWFLGGVRAVHPEAWERFVTFLPEAERMDVLQAYYKRLMHPSPEINQPAARAWVSFEMECSTLYVSSSIHLKNGIGSPSLALARIEAHYFVNDMFLETNLLDAVPTFSHLPCAIVQGRYDMVCPIVTANELHQVWAGSKIIVVNDAGHSAMEPSIRRGLVAATEAFKSNQNFDTISSSP
tara:strand:+ start:1591 stop:2595 length:1005 start_codon:yes stop_codon:yes gene_type:complete